MNSSQNNHNQLQLEESTTQEAQVETNGREVTVPSGGILLIPFSFVIVAWALVFLSRLEFWKSVGNRVATPKPCRKSPCLECRFYQNNPYLKCAVHPDKALSTEAKDCPDYWSRKQDKFSR